MHPFMKCHGIFEFKILQGRYEQARKKPPLFDIFDCLFSSFWFLNFVVRDSCSFAASVDNLFSVDFFSFGFWILQ